MDNYDNFDGLDDLVPLRGNRVNLFSGLIYYYENNPEVVAGLTSSVALLFQYLRQVESAIEFACLPLPWRRRWLDGIIHDDNRDYMLQVYCIL